MIKASVTSCLLGLTLLGSGNAEAGFLLSTVHGQYFYPNTSTSYQDLGDKVVNPTASFDFTSAGGITFTVSDAQIVTSGYLGPAEGGAFNGAVFTIVDPSSLLIANVVIDPATNVPGFDSSRVSFTSTSIAENVQGLVFPSNPDITLDVTFAATTPEPGSIVLAGLGLVIVVGSRLRVNARGRAPALTPGRAPAAPRG